MQRSTQPLSDCLLTHGGLMIALGTAVCATGSLMAMPIHAVLGYLVAAALIGVCLLMSFMCFGARYKRAMPSRVIAAYVTVGLLMVCYTAYSAIYWGWLETPVVGLFAGLLGLLWAGWFMSLAFTFPRLLRRRSGYAHWPRRIPRSGSYSLPELALPGSPR